MNALNSTKLIETPRNSGIALVIVLGMLAVLVLFGVAFSISMRTERMATRAYLDVVRARHLTQTALYRVMGEALTAEMQNQVYPDRELVYPDREVFTGSNVGTNLDLLGDGSVSSSTRFIPMSLRSSAWPVAFGGVDWLELRNPVTDEFMGEYGYLVVNCSGLLDANVIGKPIIRDMGFEEGEIRFTNSVLPEVANSTLNIYRNAFKRFESVPELYYLTSGTGAEFVSGTDALGPQPLRQVGGALPAPNSNSFMADHLHVFSRYPRGYANSDLTANTNVAYIGGSPSTWSTNLLLSALGDIAPNPIANLDHFIAVLHDYADEGYNLYGANDAEKFERISSKRVPMVNEVAISNQFVLTRTDPLDPDSQHTLVHRVYVVVETWYPFTESDGSRFRVQYGAGAGAGQNVVFTKPPSAATVWPELAGTYTCIATNLEPAGLGGDFIPSPNSYQLTTYVFQATRTAPTGPDLPLPPPSFTFAIEIDLQPIRVLYGGVSKATNDLVLAAWPTFDLEDEISIEPNGVPVTLGRKGASVNDPRINWDPRVPAGQWVVGAPPTLGEFNKHTVADGPADELPSGGTGPLGGRMYSRQGPMRSVGEVGYLLFSASHPWETVRLMNPDSQNTSRIIDRLTVHTNLIRKGMVNINTKQMPALASAFIDMPINMFPDQSGVPIMTDVKATNLASHIVGNRIANDPIDNLSEFKDLVVQSYVDTLLGSAGNKFIRESLLRNTCGLLGTRHNLFTILLAARVFSDGYDETDPQHVKDKESYVMADQRAVAVVWRDPFVTKDSAGIDTHQTFVQYFHWITGVLE